MVKEKRYLSYWNSFRTHKRFRVCVLLLGVLLALVAFEEIADDVFQDPKVHDHEAQSFDRSITKFTHQFRSEYTTKVISDLTSLGSISVIGAFYIIFVSILLSYRDYRGVVFITVIIAGSAFWPWFLKPLFARVRPEETQWLVRVSHLSFPSGHSFGAAASYTGLAYYASLYARRWYQEVFFYFLAALLTAIVGITRIYLGVHFPTDVLGGVSGGMAWGFLTCAIYEFWFRTRRLPIPGSSIFNID